MQNSLNKITILLIICGLFIFACKSSKTTASKYVGEWHYTFDWEGTEYPIKMVINSSDDGYSGMFSSEWGDLPLDDLVIEDGNLTATYDFQGNLVNFKGTFEGDTFIGMSSAGGYEIPMEAQRRNE